MNESLSQRLGRLRIEHNLSQEQLANVIGVSRQAVSKWERGESTPDTDNLIALADEYGVSLDELIRGERLAAETSTENADVRSTGEILVQMTDSRPHVETADAMDSMTEEAEGEVAPEAAPEPLVGDVPIEEPINAEAISVPMSEEQVIGPSSTAGSAGFSQASPANAHTCFADAPDSGEYSTGPTGYTAPNEQVPPFPTVTPEPKQDPHWLRWVGIILVVLLLARTASCVLGLVNYVFMPDSNSTANSMALSQSFDAASINDISIDWTAGTVEVVVVPDDTSDEITVSEESPSGWRNTPHMVADREAGMLSIWYGQQSGGLLSCAFSQGKHLTVAIPQNCAERLGLFSVDGASGEYHVSGITCKQFVVDLSSGEFEASGVTADDLDVELSSGGVTFDGSVHSSLMLDVASGIVDVSSDAVPKTGDIDVASGAVAVRLPADAGFTANVDVSSGDFDCDYLTTRSGDRYIAGDGSMDLTIDLSSGEVYLTQL